MKQVKDLSKPLFFTVLIFIVVNIGLCIVLLYQITHNKGTSQILNPEYLHGYKLDLPEEISIAKESDSMGITIKDSTIEIYFKH